MKILLLGGNQFLGRAISQKLIDLNYDIYLLNRGNRDNPKGAKFIKSDRDDYDELSLSLKDLTVDIIIDVSGYKPIQIENIYKVMRNKFRQYIYISSASIYNNIKTFPISENEQTGENQIWGEYAKNKYLSEQKILEYSSECFYTIFRPFYIYGIGNNLDRESYIFSRLKNNLPIYLPNKGEEIIQFGYIDDLVEAIVYSIDNPKFYNNIFNISGEEILTFNNYVKVCGEIMNKKVDIRYVNLEKTELKARDWFPFRDTHLFGDISKIKSTGYRNKYKLIDGLSETYKYLEENKLLSFPKLHWIEEKNNIINKESIGDKI